MVAHKDPQHSSWGWVQVWLDTIASVLELLCTFRRIFRPLCLIGAQRTQKLSTKRTQTTTRSILFLALAPVLLLQEGWQPIGLEPLDS